MVVAESVAETFFQVDALGRIAILAFCELYVVVCAVVFSCTMASPATVPNVTARVMNAVRVVRPLERIKARQALLRTNMCTSPVLLSRTNQYGSTIVALRDRFLAQYCYTPQ